MARGQIKENIAYLVPMKRMKLDSYIDHNP